MTSRVAAIVLVAGIALEAGNAFRARLFARPLFTDSMPVEEFAARRAKVMERIGDGVAVLQGATEPVGFVKFRQNNHFYYLTGVEAPRALLAIDGRTRSATLYLPPRDAQMERSEGPILTPGEEAARLTGISTVRQRDEFARALTKFGVEARAIYTPYRMETLGAGSPDRTRAHTAATSDDPWDRRRSRESVFIDKLRERAPKSDIRNLDPILDELRMIKSSREVALVREATRIAGEAIIEVMRSAGVGMREHELEAIGDYFFKRHGAQGAAYFGLVAAGRNAHYPHYHSGQGTLEDGDFVLYDYAPDYQYYTSDVTRQFPANGKFSAEQKELYGIYVSLYQALMQSIRSHAAPRVVIGDAARRMNEILDRYRFTKSKYRDAATRFVEYYRNGAGNSLGHLVGMEVHDVGVPYGVLKPGMIFTIEPALTIPEDRVYIRLEDTILITETGYENLSGFVPVEIDEIEKLMAETGRFERQVRTSTGGR